MSPILGVAGIICLALLCLLLALSAPVLYTIRQMNRPPDNPPKRFIKDGGRDKLAESRQVVVCLGASIVHGRVCPSFVDLLARRFPESKYTFINAGVNGDSSYHVLQRLDAVVGCDPDFIVILVGTNDVICTLRPDQWKMYRGEKRLPQPPTLESYRDNLRDIVRQLKVETRAKLALCSLPLMGEDLKAAGNERVAEFNGVIREVAAREGVAYLPVYEVEADYIRDRLERERISPGRPYTGDALETLRLGFVGGIRHYVLGQSYDAIGSSRRMLLKSDLIHGNSREAEIIAELVSSFLSESSDPTLD
jgi:lysophospholipase L1-like esterase